MDCQQAKILSIGHILGDLDSDSEQSRQLESHLVSCPACTEEYESSKEMIEFIEEHKAIFAEVLRTPEEQKAADQEEIKRSWAKIEAKLDESGFFQKPKVKPRIFRLFVKISAIAACLVISIAVFGVFSDYSKSKVASKAVSQQSNLKPAVKIELELNNGNIFLPAGQQIVSGEDLKVLIINDRHRMVMNVNTVLSIGSSVQNGNIGCLVKLEKGHIYTHVLHDGNPFIVDTASGKAVITGTTFDVKVTNASTTLIVSEGTVEFKSDSGNVNVTGGQISRIIGLAAPTAPKSCNASELTAWATGGQRILANVEPDADMAKFLSMWPKVTQPIDLDKIDYNRWVNEKRDWFKLQFPWIFQLQHALANEGVEVEYPQLLFNSGDLWKFAYVKDRADKSSLSFDSLLKVAAEYGFDKQWLLDNVSSAKYALENPVMLSNSGSALDTFEQWSSIFIDLQKCSTVDYDTQYSIFQANVYLVETRSLIWFSIKNDNYNLIDKERDEILDLLQKEVNAANICKENTLHVPQNRVSCNSEANSQYSQWIDIIASNVKTIVDVEKEFSKYEIGR